MNRIFVNIIQWAAWVIGGLTAAFFLMIILAHASSGDLPSEEVRFTELLFGPYALALAALGLLVAYIRPLIGGLIATIVGIAIIFHVGEYDIIWFYLLPLSGILHILAWRMKKSEC